MCPLWRGFRVQGKAFERDEESQVFLCVRQGCNIFLGFELMQAKKADGARRNVWDVVEYLITIPDVKEAMKADGSKVKLRFAADGRHTSRRIGTVKAVFNIMSEGKQTYEYQYTLALYNGKWRYSSFIRKGSTTINYSIRWQL